LEHCERLELIEVLAADTQGVAVPKLHFCALAVLRQALVNFHLFFFDSGLSLSRIRSFLQAWRLQVCLGLVRFHPSGSFNPQDDSGCIACRHRSLYASPRKRHSTRTFTHKHNKHKTS
jgi:hypothetical protein